MPTSINKLSIPQSQSAHPSRLCKNAFRSFQHLIISCSSPAVVFACIPMFVSIDLHSSKPCFSGQFVDTYSIHSFTSSSRRTQQIQPFPQSGTGVCPMGKASFLCCYDGAKTARLALRNNKWEFMSRPILRQHGIGRMAVHVTESSRDYIIRRHCQKLVIEISI